MNSARRETFQPKLVARILFGEFWPFLFPPIPCYPNCSLNPKEIMPMVQPISPPVSGHYQVTVDCQACRKAFQLSFHASGPRTAVDRYISWLKLQGLTCPGCKAIGEKPKAS